MSVRTGDLTKLTPCLKKLVPLIQQQNPMVALARSGRDPALVFIGESAGAAVFSLAAGTAKEVRPFAGLGQVRTIN